MAAVVVLSGVLFFYRLGAEPFQDYDEATYAEVVHESFTNHDFLSLHFLGVNYFRKPPLLFWLMGASQTIMPDVQTADRMPAAAAGFLAVIVVMMIVYAVTGNGYAAAFGGGILLATSAFLEPAREVRFDTLASLLDMLALYAFFKARTRRVWLIWLGAFLGLAILAKGPLVLYAIAAIVAVAPYLREFRIFRHSYAWGGLAALLLIVLPWHIYETVKFGLAFWHEYVGVQVLDRVAGQLFIVSTTNSGYFAFLAWFAAPWSELFLASILFYPFLRHHMTRELRAGYIAALAGAGSVLAICLITQTKAISYLIPLYPFMAVALAIMSFALVQHMKKNERLALCCLGVALLAIGLGYSIYNGFHLNPDYGPEVSLAYEEQAIGNYLRAAHAPTFYVYNVTTLGSVMYYNGIVQPPWLSAYSHPAPGSYVLYNTRDAQKLTAEYPSVQFVPVVSESVLTLAEVRSR